MCDTLLTKGPNQHYVIWEQGRPYNHGIWNLIDPYIGALTSFYKGNLNQLVCVGKISAWAKKPPDGIAEPNRVSCPDERVATVIFYLLVLFMSDTA